MAIKENVLPLAQSSCSGTYIRTLSSGGESQRAPFDIVKGAITADMDDAIEAEAEARESADTQLETELNGKVDKVTGKGLSTNDFTNALKTKMDGIEAGAEVNTIETVKVNGTALVPDANRAVNVPAPTVDSALSTTSENPVQNKVITGAINGIQDELNDKPNWTVGSAEQIVSDEASQTDVTPYTFRRSGGGLIPFNFDREELAKVVGGTVAWNQLCNSSSVTVPNGHKYYMVKVGTASIGASTGSAITGLTSGTDMVVDLTAMLGTTIANYIYSLETATAGSGIAKLKEWGFFRDSYYSYDPGSLQSVCVGAHEMRDADDNVIGNYALDSTKTLRGRFYLDSNNQLRADGDVYPPSGEIDRRYGVITVNGSSNVTLRRTGTSNSLFGIDGVVSKVYAESEMPNAISDKLLPDTAYNAWRNETPLFAFTTTGQTLWFRLPGITTLADAQTYLTSNPLQVVYEKATPTTETADPYTAVQICDSDGTEEFVDALVEAGTRDVDIPAGTETTYFEDMASKLAQLPPIPGAPSANGTYTLQAVVSSGAVTYQWTS